MPIIALSGLRGGTGVTSVAAGLAWALCQAGESVLVIDFSPDNLLRLHFNMPYQQPRGWARAEIDGQGWHQGAMQYNQRLAFLPFGIVSGEERRVLLAPAAAWTRDWLAHLALLRASRRYDWILLDIPHDDSSRLQPLMTYGDRSILLINPDANCHARLHQQPLPDGTNLLINKYIPTSLLQRDLLQLWLQTLEKRVPITLHRDEAMAEALAAKRPVGEYRPDSKAAEEMVTLATWCLIHCKAPDL